MEKTIFGCLIFLGALMFYMMFVMLPVLLYADAKCLADGYPTSRVTIGLEIYCSTLDGAVTVKVDKLK